MTQKIEPLIVAEGNCSLSKPKRLGEKEWRECLSCYQREGRPHARECRHQLNHVWGHLLPHCDFRSISRESDRVFTKVHLLLDPYERNEYLWIHAGQGNLDRFDDRTGCHTLRVYLGRGATDFEHDSAYVLQLPIFGVTFKHVWYNSVELIGFIPPDMRRDDFKVPAAGYDPFEHPETEMCDPDPEYHGADHKPHPIVPQGMYVPQGSKEQWQLVRGKRVRIVFGPVRKDESDEG